MNGLSGESFIFEASLNIIPMKRNIWIFGSIAGAILVAFLIYATATCYANPEKFESNDVVGYIGFILIFSLIFVGVKNYRDKYSNGLVSFGRAFKIGAFIALIASSMYTLAWIIDYYLFIPDFLDQYTKHVLWDAKQDGATAAELAKKTEEMADFKEMYKNPLLVVIITYMEVLPIGLIVALIAALILKKKRPAAPSATLTHA